jgi:alpha-1,3/alpha-1,6-mannosyltransferase
LLEHTKILLYTPENEHFGIVPVEAMHMGCTVIACNSGGPLESVDDGKTGFLVAPDHELWGQKIIEIMNASQDRQVEMRDNAKKREKAMFTKEVFAEQLDTIMQEM